MDLYKDEKCIKARLRLYRPINPIQATKMPPKEIIIPVLKAVWAEVGAKVWAEVGDQVRAEVEAKVGAEVWDQVGATAYFEVKKFLNLNYEHPAFDLIRIGVFVVNVDGMFRVFGKGGMFLGEIDENEI